MSKWPGKRNCGKFECVLFFSRFAGRTVAKSTIEVTDCDSGNVKFLEHVQCHVTLGASRRGDVVIYLVSPSGTRSNLVARRPKDYSRAGFNDWPFLSVRPELIL